MLVRIDPGNSNTVEEVESVSFASLPFANGIGREEHLEDLIADNVGLLESAFAEEDASTLLIIGRQVRTTTARRMDLVALDGSGSLILIEVKRDADDVRSRRDHAEIQAVRYAASLATLRSVDELVANIYGPYIQKYRADELQAQGGGRTAEEWARRKLVEFMRDNDIERSRLNHRQEIILVGAGFDDDTRSACAWMAKYKVPIRLIEVQPARFGGHYFLNVNQLIPPAEYEDFYVDLVSAGDGVPATTRTSSTQRRTTRLRLKAIMDAGKVRPGDEIYLKLEPSKRAKLVDAKKCEYEGEELTIMNWAKDVTGWSAVNIYEWITHAPSGRMLEELRQEVEAEQEGAIRNDGQIACDSTNDSENDTG